MAVAEQAVAVKRSIKSLDFKKCTGNNRIVDVVSNGNACCAVKATTTEPEMAQSAMDAPELQANVDPAKAMVVIKMTHTAAFKKAPSQSKPRSFSRMDLSGCGSQLGVIQR